MENNTFNIELIGFQWDDGNGTKNQIKHRVSKQECEEVFFNEPLILYEDEIHSLQEKRYYLLGKTDFQRELMIVFTVRNNLIRVISARDMSNKEKLIYEQESLTYV